MTQDYRDVTANMTQPNDPESESGESQTSKEDPSSANLDPQAEILAQVPDQKSSTPPSNLRLLRNRLVAGLFVILPIFITYFVVKWLYETLNLYLIDPLSNMFLMIWKTDADGGVRQLPWSVEYIGAPGAAIALVLAILLVAGMFFRSRLHRFVDWLLSTVPGVSTVYNAVSNVVDAISRSQDGADNFKRVVLVPFPHPGMRVPAFVTSECTDINTGREILCVYVPTTPVPTSGYMILVPEDDVIAINWDIQETLQAIVSGGITVPDTVVYDQPPPINIST